MGSRRPRSGPAHPGRTTVMGNEWFYTQNGQAAPAPVSSEQLRLLAGGGQLRPDDLVWKEGMPNWTPAASIKGLFGSAKQPSGDIPVLPSAPAEAPAPRQAPAPRPAPANGASKGARPAPAGKDEDGGGIADLHPLLVFALTLMTLGLFGVVFAVLVANQYAGQAPRRGADAAGRPLGKVRHPVWILLMSYLTLGFYFCYWVYAALRECAAYAGKRDLNPRAELSLMLAFPPYAVYVAVFRLPELIRRCQTVAGVPESGALSRSYVFLNPFMLPALPFLGMIYQDSLNHVWLKAP